MINVYTDGSCQGNPGPGGWAAIIVDEVGNKRSVGGHEDGTSNNRMEITAVIGGLNALPEGVTATVFTDSQYVVNTMAKGWRRTANGDLWDQLDSEVAKRNVKWQWVRSHNGSPGNSEANGLAVDYARMRGLQNGLTHLDSRGRVQMVNVSDKEATSRIAVARASVCMKPETLSLIREGKTEKGDVISAARIAGIMGAKRTSELIPMCHPIPLDNITLEMEADEVRSAIDITATTHTVAKTGVEMEALTAVSVAALTIYDMAKAMDRGMRIENMRVTRKSGGKSGDILLEQHDW